MTHTAPTLDTGGASAIRSRSGGGMSVSGAATTGHENILDIEPVDIHQRVPLIFGSVHEVRLLEHYYREAHPYQERSQLFGNRGLFRSS